MRIYTATLVAETNSFSPFPTALSDFEALGISRTPADYERETFFTESALHIRRLGEADGHEVVLGPSAFADPGGPVIGSVYAALRNELVRQIDDEGPFDAVLLTLHGAMIAQGCDDCEGDLLEAVRRRIGEHAFLGAMLDPHCHLTRRMAGAADALVTMKEYPHVDGKQRLADLYGICIETLAGRARPVSVLVDCQMVGIWPTTHEPVRALVDRLRACEQAPPLLSMSFIHGFPWGDVEEGGARMLAIADGDIAAAEAAGLAMAREIGAARAHSRLETVAIGDALQHVAAARGLVVLADVADNPGGGAPGDSTFILRALLEAGLTGIAIGLFHDGAAVERCRSAGVGGEVRLELGGRHGPVSGEPVVVQARVRGFREDHFQLSAGGAAIPLGPSAWIETAGIHILVTRSRHQIIDPTAFAGLGLDIVGLNAVVLKSTNHFRAGFEPIATRILSVETHGALTPDFASIPYCKRSPDYWPRRRPPPEPAVLLRTAARRRVTR